MVRIPDNGVEEYDTDNVVCNPGDVSFRSEDDAADIDGVLTRVDNRRGEAPGNGE